MWSNSVIYCSLPLIYCPLLYSHPKIVCPLLYSHPIIDENWWYFWIIYYHLVNPHPLNYCILWYSHWLPVQNLGSLTLGLRPREDKLSVAGDATRPQGVLQYFAGFFLNLLLWYPGSQSFALEIQIYQRVFNQKRAEHWYHPTNFAGFHCMWPQSSLWRKV